MSLWILDATSSVLPKNESVYMTTLEDRLGMGPLSRETVRRLVIVNTIICDATVQEEAYQR